MDKETGKHTDTSDYKKNPGQESGQHLPNRQDPSKKNPGQDNKQDHEQGDQDQDIRRRAS